MLQISSCSVMTLLFETTCCPLISPIDHEFCNTVWYGNNVRNDICINWIFYYCKMCNKHNADYGAQKQTRGCNYGQCKHMPMYVCMFTTIISTSYIESQFWNIRSVKIIPDVYFFISYFQLSNSLYSVTSYSSTFFLSTKNVMFYVS